MLPLLLVLCGHVWGSQHHVEASAQISSSQDSSFCFDGLELSYPEMDVYKCLTLPKDLGQKISTVWGAPLVRWSAADEKKKYVLAMVDPYAPSRTTPTSAYWRHWLVINIQGCALKEGQLRGTTITVKQTNAGAKGFATDFGTEDPFFSNDVVHTQRLAVWMSSKKGQWDLMAFIHRFGLGTPVAAVQFLTQNYKD
ncbi:phosphatidylethanolamine-binding protein 4 [Nerophis lumbriciformis]|uniref:phosphatidylethanolamine-binding protein 4 n=1 Tax=Nerophis lumbriciformis TaxID=546530 RepID=UPI003BAAF300